MKDDKFMYYLVYDLFNKGCKSINVDNLYTIAYEAKNFIKNYNDPIVQKAFSNAQSFVEHFIYIFTSYSFGTYIGNYLNFDNELQLNRYLDNDHLKIVGDIATYIYYLNIEYDCGKKKIN